MIADSWKKAIDGGVTRMDWATEDNNAFTAKQMERAKKYTDQYPEDAQFMKIVADYNAFLKGE